MYVNPSVGDDANSGSAASPLATLSRAASLATPGTTVHVSDGIYREGDVTPISARADSRIRFVGNGDSVLSGSMPLSSLSWSVHSGSVMVATVPSSWGITETPFTCVQYDANNNVRVSCILYRV